MYADFVSEKQALPALLALMKQDNAEKERGEV